jgi:hypothetical protein
LKIQDTRRAAWGIRLPQRFSRYELNEAALRERDDPSAGARQQQEALFLRTRIFGDLTILLPSWYSEHIAHFNTNHFITVLDRCSKAGAEVFGVEAFSTDGVPLGVNIPICAADLSHSDFMKSLRGEPYLSSV